MSTDGAPSAELPGARVAATAQRVCRTLLTAPAERVAAEASLREFSASTRGPEALQHAQFTKSITNTRDQAIAAAQEELGRVSSEATARLQRQLARIEASERAACQAGDRERVELLEQAQTRVEEGIWTADTMYEAQEPVPKAQFEALEKAMADGMASAAEHAAGALEVLARAGILPREDAHAPEAGASLPDGDPATALQAMAREASEIAQRLRGETVPRLLRVKLVHVTLAIVLAGTGAVVGWITTGAAAEDIALPAGIGLACAFVSSIFGWAWAGRRLRRIAEPLRSARVTAAAIAVRAVEEGRKRRATMEAEYKAQHARERKAARSQQEPAVKEIELLYARKRRVIHDSARTLETNSHAQARTVRETAECLCNEACTAAHAAHDAAVAAEQLRHTTRIAELDAIETTRLRTLRNHWSEAQRQVIEDGHALVDAEHAHFPRWSDPSWKSFCGPKGLVGCARVGSITVALKEIPGAIPDDPALAWPGGAPRVLHVPIVLALPRDASLLVETPRDGRAQGIAIMQEAIMRILAATTPGMARFTLVDPVGLGEGFAALMHLADDAEHLIGERIWTDRRHIEQRLSDLCQHMETVIQKFLRNEFETLDEYNRRAGEIAEPYRFLVLCDFPTGISEIAAKHLASIINSGPRCGVFTLILRDLAASLPAPLTDDDLRGKGRHLSWRDGHFWDADVWIGKFPITISHPPTKEETIALLKRIGTAARDSKRVEVPFSAIAPCDDALWTESTADRIEVPLGRSGATRLQSLLLGVGTSQHALIAGKTGSGKSTLLHALITNLALRFSPDEAELWLIDFKKGVEFRTYATNALPHARVVAVESDREFGLSVLKGLDQELRRRGEIFRGLGVQDLAGFRRAKSPEVLPRSLLIIDEFQELFTEDDKVSEESALLLDRLVRQGRAFGMHVVLGSQTLGGAYSIARATMGQMAVRIALQCNEADSQLILADDNLAGRLLSRPGDAIYNDSGGLIEGNNPFQVVWLGDEERDRRLARVRAQLVTMPPRRTPSMIVFEGNAPAHLDENRALGNAIAARRAGSSPRTPLVWLGDPISIKDPTGVALARQTGANVMVIGQRDDAAIAVAATAVVSLAGQFPRGQCKVLLIDGTAPDAAEYGRLAALAQSLPIDTRVGEHRDAEAILASVHDELLLRQASNLTMAPTWLLLVHGLHRLRALRRNEDDYSFSSSSGAALTPDKVLAAILKEGPSLGIHVMATCDSATNLARAFDRNAIREFDWRVLFQVSASDSSTLIDSPVASRLGPLRALLHSEETGVQEKFRPYSWPEPGWTTSALS